MAEADSKQKMLMKNLLSHNLDRVKKLGDSFLDILKDKHKQKDLGMDVTFEKCLFDTRSVKVMDVSERGA